MDVSDIFYFSAQGKGRGSPRRQERGGRFFVESLKGGGGVPGEGPRGPRGRKGVCWEFRGRGAKYFFGGAEIPTKNIYRASYQEHVPRKYFVIISARMVFLRMFQV